jgi:hypothetical protein
MLVRLQNSSALSGTMRSQRFPSVIEEAQFLVRKCAEPCPAGDNIKGAIRRSSERLQLSFTRIRDIWYGDARRIDAKEMDRLRQVADEVELAQAVAGVELAIKRIESSGSPEAAQVIAGLVAAIEMLKFSHNRQGPVRD